MKLTLLLSLLTISQLWATETYSQMTKLNLKLENVKISDALKEIENQSEFFFLYSPKLIDVERKVNIDAKEESIKDILSNIFDEKVKFVVYDRQIILSPNEIFEVLSAAQQKNQISGTVIDKNGTPQIGVNVLVTGTTQGTITDISGKYTIEVPKGAKSLTFSFIGMVTQEISIGTLTQIDVTIAESAIGLDEVVVIGYGTQKKSLVTGAISSVNVTQIATVSTTGVEQVLQGRTAGVYVLPNSGTPGSSTRIRIRGVGSNGITEPLYIVDGVRAKDIAFLNSSEVASMEVLKDAASSAIYGAEGANGVVIVTTKTGKKNSKPNISYSGQFGIQSVGKIMPVMNAEQYTTYMTEAGNPYAPTQAELAAAGKGTDWLKEVFKPAPMNNNSINITGGSEKSSYLIGGSASQQQGIAGKEKAQYNRYTFRVNSDHEVKPWLRLRNRLSYSHIDRNILPEDTETGAGSILYNAVRMDPLTPVVYTGALPAHAQAALDGGYKLIQDKNGNYYGVSQYVNSVIPPLTQIDITHIKFIENRLIGSLSAEADLLKGLTFKTSYSIDFRYNKRHQWVPTYWTASQAYNIQSSVNDNNYDSFMSQFENYLTYDGKINDHNYNLLLGTSAIMNTINNLYGYSVNMFREEDKFAWQQFNPSVGKLTNGYEYKTSLLSYFGRVSYDYKNKYLFNATLRYDGSSLLPPEHQWGLFPSASIGWVASKENFFSSEAIDFLRFRLSWGQNGSLSNLNPGAWNSAITSQDISYPNGVNTLLVGAEPSSIANRNLVWETGEQTDFGVDLRLFKSKLVFSADYFNKTTKDLITPGSPPGFAGFSIPYINGGDISNKGFEFEIGYTQPGNDLNYGISFNFTKIKNEVTYLNPAYPRIQGASIYPGWIATAFEVGYPVWYFRGYKTNGIFQDQTEIDQYIADNNLTGYSPKPGDVRVVNVNGDNIISPDDQTYIGSPHPDFMFGGRISLDYKGFDLLLFAQGQVGNDVLIGFLRTDTYTNNRPAFMYEDRWTGPGSTNSWFRSEITNKFNYQSDKMVFDASFIRIRQLQIGYTLSERLSSKLNIKNLRVYISLDNYFTFTNYPGIDPEAGSESRGNGLGIDRVVYPISKIALCGMTLNF